ncbi:MAG: NAD(P)H-dependent oxidoreductase [Chitinophagaceae bacterium]|nr:NAD(P)H-dependent oxidoreductase [Chitinophagaceae bacterium]
MSLIEKLNWRYATKRMNGQAVANEKINNILEAIRLAPSSAGLQPYHCIVVSNKEMLAKINAEACKQPQVMECSHFIVFAAWKDLSEQQVADFISNIATTRNVSLESLDGFKANLVGMANRPAAQNFDWAARQAYIGLGFGLIAAAHECVDATPMEGFDNAIMDSVLGLEAKGLASVCLLAIGYRDEQTDYLVNAKKVRRAEDEMFTKI